MKKWIAVLLALMILFCAAAAENVQESAPDSEVTELFYSTWADGFMMVKIYPEGDHWRVWIRNDDGTVEWYYSCLYDSEQKALVADQDKENVKSVFTLGEDLSIEKEEVVYKDGAAVFYVDADGRLVWTDEKEGIGSDRSYEKIGWFEGAWDSSDETGSYIMNCFWDVEEPTEGEVYAGYKVEIERYEDEEYTHWYYPCLYNAENGTLEAIFSSKEYAEKEGEPLTEVYTAVPEEGEETTVFCFDDEGCIRWKDPIEDAGKDLQFQPSNG